jgi:hypothetical protein
MIIHNEDELLAYFDGDSCIKEIAEIEKYIRDSIYDNTCCGAWFQFDVLGFTIGSIVEGSDAEFSKSFNFPVESLEIESWINELEDLTDDEWNKANSPYPVGYGPESAYYCLDGPLEQRIQKLEILISDCENWGTDEAEDLIEEAKEYLEEINA